MNKFLIKSPYSEDAGQEIGEDPRKIDTDDLSAQFKDKTPIKAIRAKCIDCCCGQKAEVRKCTATDCPLWPYRMGVNVFHGKT